MSEGNDNDELLATRRYYDEFAAHYDDARGGRVEQGYHDLIDDLEIDFLARFGRGATVLEVGCGTGLLLERIARFAKSAEGVDLSPAMLARAKSRGLDVREASATCASKRSGSATIRAWRPRSSFAHWLAAALAPDRLVAVIEGP